ncbi:MAG: 16S rRNA (adenine(1518)-N(6)/adenine(1519)-N(6))-dimethyltransferase RsmA [Bacteroidales bacterium]|nr:16S rRNA (adenine(1518)-N(6)/adenine(1519)-N(6))-dimethyltransferase RsmA [Bacteroidales bacterium]
MVRAKKHLGQHFLTDRNIASKIADLIPNERIAVLEIGPGTGILTSFLVKRPNPLTVIEVDDESIAHLKTMFPHNEAEIIHGDFLSFNITTHFPDEVAIIGNFPYNISSQILFSLLQHKSKIPFACGMFQKEVAERIIAPHGNKQYGILSVLIQTWYHTKYMFTVEPGVFSPPPKVRSGMLQLTKKHDDMIPDVDPSLFKKLVKTAFNQRRKMLSNALSVLQKPIPAEFSKLRAEQLSVQNFHQLYQQVFETP